MLSLKKSFTEQPARPDDAHAHAQAQEDAHAQAHDDAQDEWCEEPPERDDRVEVRFEEDRGLMIGTFTTFTWM